MGMKFAKLITECNSVCLIKGKYTEEQIIEIFLKPTIQDICKYVAENIVNAKLLKPHHYRFNIQVHAQEFTQK